MVHIDWVLGNGGVEGRRMFEKVEFIELGAMDESHHYLTWWLGVVREIILALDDSDFKVVYSAKQVECPRCQGNGDILGW